ncbi:hypothetical protein ARMGADRAFT_1087121 [Armillaria gallica]|uniref:Uncharacterized protein n=1 Tax=Armillaria gallica TaxID=47427 RepID=A0A2H3CWI6_ARMGA|nr:hypothetical protein ARMGADRAFT_1087121 [Armillaria gallica]
MENDDASIIAISLGIPSTTLLSITLILAIRFRYRPLQQIETPHAAPTVITTPTNDFNGILLEPQSPQIIAPIPQRPIPINELLRPGINEEEEDISESPAPVILERRSPTPPRRREPIVIISPTGSAESALYVPQTLSPGIPIAPSSNHDTWAERDPIQAPPEAADPDQEIWDNLLIPYSAYFPSLSVWFWDQPVQAPEWSSSPVPMCTGNPHQNSRSK